LKQVWLTPEEIELVHKLAEQYLTDHPSADDAGAAERVLEVMSVVREVGQ
jgi:hypothetical protein